MESRLLTSAVKKRNCSQNSKVKSDKPPDTSLEKSKRGSPANFKKIRNTFNSFQEEEGEASLDCPY